MRNGEDMTELYNDVKKAFLEDELLIISHKNCPDGTGAVWALAEALDIYTNELSDITHFMQYGDTLDEEEYEDKFVLILDFSFKRDTLLKIKEVAKRVVVIDHHKTAEEDLKGLEDVIFDIDESGTTLTWKALKPYDPIPQAFLYIKDRDLWQFHMPDTHAFTEGFRKLVTLNDLDSLVDIDPDDIDEFITEATKERVEFKNEIVEGIADPKKIKMVTFNGVDIPTVNNHQFISEVGNEIAKNYPESMSAQWFISENDKEESIIVFSLRSIEDNDVSEIAKQFGGGGHKNAAGFSIPVKGNLERLILNRVVNDHSTVLDLIKGSLDPLNELDTFKYGENFFDVFENDQGTISIVVTDSEGDRELAYMEFNKNNVDEMVVFVKEHSSSIVEK